MAKSKDPAFLFYASDFMMGTTFFSNEQVGKYIRLLCVQHQHGGMIDKNSFCSLVGDDPMIRSKFVECEHGFYNERLAQEMERRQKKSGNISKAAKETWEKRKLDKEADTIVIQSYNNGNGIVIRPENEDENEIVLEEIGSEKIREIANEVWKDQIWKEQICMGLSINMEELKKWLAQFNSSIASDNIPGFNSSKYKKMSRGWITAQKSKGVKVETGNQRTSSAPTLTYLKPI